MRLLRCKVVQAFRLRITHVARLACVVLGLYLLAGCGWQLRGLEQYRALGGEGIEAVNLSINADNRLFESVLRKQLGDRSIDISPSAPLTLVVERERSERRPLSYSSTGIPIQYQLIMTVRFGVNQAGQTPVQRTLTARRQYDFDTALIVAKNEEQLNLLQEMREELVARIIASLGQQDSGQ